MTLAGMIALDENALICDFAETYQIYNWRSLPVQLAATLAAGLRDDSRIKMKARGDIVPTKILLLGMLFDRLGDYLYSSGAYRDRPDRITSILMGEGQTGSGHKNGYRTFSSPEDFWTEWSKY